VTYDEVTEADCSGYVILAYNGVQFNGKTAGFQGTMASAPSMPKILN